VKYVGGKIQIGKQIAAIINSYQPKTYHEPFCGMYGVGRHVKAEKRSGADLHPDLILFLRAAQRGWVGPESMTSEEYKALRHAEPSALRGFAGFGLAFSGKWFSGFVYDARQSPGRYDHIGAARRNCAKIAQTCADVEFRLEDYRDYSGGADVIYCDPPYAGVYGYSVGKFDSARFWDWVRDMSGESVVLVSEYTAPPDFECIWARTVHIRSSRVGNISGRQGVRMERLFTWAGTRRACEWGGMAGPVAEVKP
jgi:DNA adenine methylase